MRGAPIALPDAKLLTGKQKSRRPDKVGAKRLRVGSIYLINRVVS